MARLGFWNSVITSLQFLPSQSSLSCGLSSKCGRWPPLPSCSLPPMVCVAATCPGQAGTDPNCKVSTEFQSQPWSRKARGWVSRNQRRRCYLRGASCVCMMEGKCGVGGTVGQKESLLPKQGGSGTAGEAADEAFCWASQLLWGLGPPILARSLF